MSTLDNIEVCENIDLLLPYQMHPKIRNIKRKGFERLYDAARNGGAPLTYTIAKALLALPPSRVAILTGILSQFLPHGESDGPLGAFVIARALRRLGHTIVFPLEKELAGPMRVFLQRVDNSDGIDVLVINRESSNRHADLLPGIDAVVAVERAGVNPAGEMHSGAGGKNRTGTRAALDGLVERVNSEGKLTVGIGDGGTEIGFGNLFEVAREVIPYGKICGCECKKGIITVTKTTYFIPASISNWGAYALVAAMAVLAEDPDMALSPEEEKFMLSVCDEVDFRDGISGRTESSVDGIPLRGTQAITGVLRTMVELALEVPHIAVLDTKEG